MTSGSKLGPYEILQPIGAGGMGEVYKARDSRLDRLVAVKLSKERFSERFEREARAVAALNHPHVCQLYDVGPNYLVMELIDGQPLKGPLPLDLALQYGAQICDALDAAHRKGIAHRDLKPANILVTKHGIKLLDFGLAKTAATPLKSGSAAADTLTRALTGKSEIVGTLHYMSPEQLQSSQEVDVRTDIFSFGLVLYEMLTGHRAFDGPSPASVIAAIIERSAPSIKAVAPPALDRVLQRCLAKNPDDRWQTARDLRAELQWIDTVGAENAASMPTTPPRRYLAVLLAALLMAVGGLGAARWFRRPAVPAPRLKVTLESPAEEHWSGPTLSPDGTRIAVHTPQGLRVRALGSLETQLITKSADSLSGPYPLAWSPDGLSLVYFDLTAGELRKVSVSGGSSQTLASGLQNFRGAAWNTDGTILFSAGGPIMRVSENGGTPAQVTSELGHFPTILPDGRHYLYLRGRGTDEAIYAGSIDSKEHRKITQANSKAELMPSGHLLFLRGTTLMAQAFDPTGLRTNGEAFPVASDVGIIAVSRAASFSASSNGFIVYQTGSVGRTALTWFDRSGKPSTVIDDSSLHYDIELAPDGSAVAATQVDPKTLLTSLWVTDLVRGTASRLTPEAEDIQFPTWSPDSKRIAYAAGSGLYLKDAAGSGQRELLAAKGSMSMPHWSPDGKALVFVEIQKLPSGNIRLLSVGGDRKPGTYLEGDFTQPAFSPDGRWMAYVSKESGKYEVFVQPVPTGHGKWQISTRGGGQPVWRQDGKELFYQSAGGKIIAVPVKIGARFEAGVAKELFTVSTFGLFYVRRHYSVSPDGQRFLVNQQVNDHPQTILLQNWLSTVR